MLLIWFQTNSLLTCISESLCILIILSMLSPMSSSSSHHPCFYNDDSASRPHGCAPSDRHLLFQECISNLSFTYIFGLRKGFLSSDLTAVGKKQFKPKTKWTSSKISSHYTYHLRAPPPDKRGWLGNWQDAFHKGGGGILILNQMMNIINQIKYWFYM